MTGALLPTDGIAADDDEVVLGGSDGRTARGTGTPGERASVAQAGGSLLLVLFGSVPDAHPQILSLVFDSMSIRKTLRCSGRWLPRICMRSTRTGPSCLTGHAACPACPR